MVELFKIVLSLSISGGILILILFLCKPLFRNRISRRCQYYIWLIVIARLLLPFTGQMSPVGALFQEADGTAEHKAASAVGQRLSFAARKEDSFMRNDHAAIQDGEAPTAAAPGAAEVLIHLYGKLWVIWLVTAMALTLRKITGYLRFMKCLKAGCREVTGTALLDRLALAAEHEGVKKPVELYTNSLISSPMLAGMFRPCIVIPDEDLPDEDLQYTIRHELTHYRRRDMFYKWLVQLTVCLHWFNPLVYVMSREIDRQCELSCDEAVIKKLNAADRRAYGNTLLNAVRFYGAYKNIPASIKLTGSRELLKERLGAIMRFQKTSRLTAAITLALVFLFSYGAMALGAYAAVPAGKETVSDRQTEADSSSGTTKELADCRIRKEGNVYFILCEDAKEADIPISGTTEGSISIVLVRRDGYMAVGPFDSKNELVEEVTRQCDFMLKENAITPEDAALIELAAASIESGEEIGLTVRKAEDREYRAWGISRENGAYYYNREPVRIFMDVRADHSFVTFTYDEQGFVNVCLSRGQDGEIINAEILTEEEADKIKEDLRIAKTAEEDSMNGSDVSAAVPDMEKVTLDSKDYYFVMSEQQLRAIGTGKYTLDKRYLLGCDIELTEEWTAIGDFEHPFTGYFSGNGSEIAGLRITDPNAEFAGLFGYAEGAVFHNVTLRNVDISSVGGEGKNVGAIVAIANDCILTDNRVID